MHPIHLCIGAPRTGTTWLFRELGEHPGIFRPTIKEVRYWNSRRGDREVESTIKNNEKALNSAYDREDQLAWIEKWRRIEQKSPTSIEEYLDLMSVPGRPSIDISPAYCMLSRPVIEQLRDDLPQGSRVVYFVRDPLDRLASQLKLHFHLHGKYRGIPSQEDIARFLENRAQQKRWDYEVVLTNWGSVFGKDFIAFNYDRLAKQPKEAILDLSKTLGFELDEKTDERDEESFFHTEANQNTRSWLPALGKTQKTYLARAVQPAVERLLERYPKYPRFWLEKVRKAASQTAPEAGDRDFDIGTQRLMRMTESIGDNCEYGFWQRHHGYEPSSLFRWALTPPDSLIEFLEKPRPLFQKDQLEPYSPGMVHDRAFGFKFHSKLVERDGTQLRLIADKHVFDEVYADEKSKIDFLRTKFFAQGRARPALYVIKENKGLSEKQIERVQTALLRLNANHMLLWAVVDPAKEAGVEQLDNCLYQGFLPYFAPYVKADAYAENGWTTLMRKLAEREEIDAITKRMLR